MAGPDTTTAEESDRYLEIVQLSNGDVILQRPSPDGVVASDEDALVRMRFSPEMLDVLGDDLLEVAEAMVEAAADAMGELQARNGDADGAGDGLGLLANRRRGPTLH